MKFGQLLSIFVCMLPMADAIVFIHPSDNPKCPVGLSGKACEMPTHTDGFDSIGGFPGCVDECSRNYSAYVIYNPIAQRSRTIDYYKCVRLCIGEYQSVNKS